MTPKVFDEAIANAAIIDSGNAIKSSGPWVKHTGGVGKHTDTHWGQNMSYQFMTGPLRFLYTSPNPVTVSQFIMPALSIPSELSNRYTIT